MFRAIILPFFRNTKLCVTACGIMLRRCCRPPATSSVHYTTFPSLFVIDRRITYENRKYHSGWMCTGVTSGLAGVKLSESLRMYGSFRASTVSIIMVGALYHKL